MDINLLNEFVVLSKYLNFSKTSKHLYIAQPVLSRHIATLEKELGVQLFIRNKQSIQLTQVGELMLSEAKAIIARYEEALQKIRQSDGGYSGSLKIGFLDAAVKKFISSLIKSFSSKHPDVDLQFVSFDLGGITQALENDEIDVGFTIAFEQQKNTGFNTRVLHTDFLSVVVSKDHPLAQRSNVSFKDLAEEQFIMHNPDQYTGFTDYVTRLFTMKGISPRVVKQTSRIDTSLLMAEIGLGVTITPRHIEVYANPNIKFIKIEDDDALVEVIVTWKSSNSNPSIPTFLEELGVPNLF